MLSLDQAINARNRALFSLGKDVGDGFTNSVLGRIEGSLLHFIGGFRIDPPMAVYRGMEIFDGRGFQLPSEGVRPPSFHMQALLTPPPHMAAFPSSAGAGQ